MWLSVLWGAPHSPVPATAAGAGVVVAEEHRAAIIIDTGTQVKSVCLRFREEAISGIEALARAQVDPVFQAFSGKGAAVCALCGVGCPAGDSCLTCNPEGKFWSYSRAPAGTSALRTSGAGASSTTVRDGDVEGWKWALGGAPPFQSVEVVCGEAAPASPTVPATTAVTTALAVTTTAAGPSATGTTVGGRAGTTTRPPAAATTTAAPTTMPGATGGGPVAGGSPAGAGASGGGDTGAGASPAGASTTVAMSDLAASRSASTRDGGGSDGGPGLALFAVALAGLVLWGAHVRRSRRAGEPSS